MNMDSEAPEVDVDGNQTPPDQFEITLTTNRSKDQQEEDSKQEEYKFENYTNPDDPRTSQMGLATNLPKNIQDMGISESAKKLSENHQQQEDGIVDIQQIIIENATNEEDIRRATLKSKKEQEALEVFNSNRTKDGQKQTYAQEYYALPWFRKPVVLRLCNFWRGVGATMMLFNHIVDVLYLMKQEFFNHKFANLILTTMVLRAVFIFIYSACQIYKKVIKFNPNLFAEESKKSAQDNQITEEERSIADKLAKKYGFMLYSGLGFNMYTGFYRVLDHKDFRVYIGMCLGLDFFFCVLPLFFLEVINNSNFPVEWGLTPLQSICAIMKALCGIEIILEVLFFIYELLKFRYMKKAGLSKVDDYSQLPEQRKRYTWAKKAIFVGLISTAIFGLCITVGGAKLNDRSCDELQSLVGPVCEDCTLQNCAQCASSGPDGCDQCLPGYVFDPEAGQCIDCDDDIEYNICLSCSLEDAKDSTKKCQECADRYRLDSYGQCMPCSNSNCDNCDLNAGTCLQCKEGYYSTPDGGCNKCSDTIPNCQQCSSGDRCDICDENVTKLDENDGLCYCDTIKNYMSSDESGQQCVCQIGYILEDNTCALCDDIIPGCRTCEMHSTYSSDYKFIGTHLEAPDQKPYLSCQKCWQSSSQFYDNVEHKCSSCKDHSDGCEKCDFTGQDCTQCTYGYYLDSTKTCIPCWSYSSACASCNSSECTRCKEGYFDWFGNCRKNPFY